MAGYMRPPKATRRARRMRHAPTDAERELWIVLRDRRLEDAKFRRQVPIGPYIVDFVCQGAKLIVEADGGQHSESGSDAFRDAWLTRGGYRVARYWNNEILTNPEGVLLDIQARLSAHRSP